MQVWVKKNIWVLVLWSEHVFMLSDADIAW